MTKRRDLILVIRVYYSSYFQRFFLLSEREFLLLVETSCCCVFYRSSAMYYTLFSCVRVADIPRVTRPLLLESNPRVVKSNTTKKQTNKQQFGCFVFLTGKRGDLFRDLMYSQHNLIIQQWRVKLLLYAVGRLLYYINRTGFYPRRYYDTNT